MTKDAPAFDFYPERWLSGVAKFSDAEQLTYLRLLCHQWLDEGLPDNTAALKRLGGKGVTPELLEKFPLCEDGKRRNARLETIRSEQRARIAKKSEQRKAAANARWERERLQNTCEKDATASSPHCGSDATASSPHCGSDAHHPPPTTHHPPPTTHPINKPHTPRAHARGVWPDPSEYPTVETVRQWAVAVMAPPECADKWHAERTAEGWLSKHGRPLQLIALRPLFAVYATAWKANENRGNQRYARPPRPADISDVKPQNMRVL
jgi:hypothetical protein